MTRSPVSQLIRIAAALRTWPYVELIEDRIGNLFKAIVAGPQVARRDARAG